MTELESLTGDLPSDPDAQATVTDFLDYTEYLPSDLVRSLRLIAKLDDTYLSSVDKVHRQSKVYGSLPNLSPDKRPNSQYLRQEISSNLDHAINARESSYAEASRLCDQVDRHYSRLSSIISKLQALPKPPSRDPTPVPRVRSPQISRTKTRADGTPPPRINLRLEGPRTGVSSGRTNGLVPRPRYRSQKITVPGEVLPPPNPDSPPPITDSEWEFGPPSPIPVATSRVGATSRNRPTKPARIRVQKSPKTHRIATMSRAPRPPGAMGTNVHSAVAGISTSNALSLLAPPPDDAKPGSNHAPWMRLTEWEMAKLRKRMKKNAIWSPSETMIRRELSEAGRGPDNYRRTKAMADEADEEFLDEDNIATSLPGKHLGPGEISTDALSLGHLQLSNRGMKLNEAKKAKKDSLQREQAALAAAEAELAAKRLADVGSSMKTLFSRPSDSALLSPIVPASQLNGKATIKEKAKEKEKEREREKEKEKEKEREKEREKEKQKQKEREKEKAKEMEIEKQRQKDAEIQRKRQQEREEEEKRKELERERQREEELQREREAEMEREKAREQERLREQEIEQEKQRLLEEEQKKEQARLEEIQKEMQRQKDIETASKASARKRKRDSSPHLERFEQPMEETVTRASSKRVKKAESQSISPKLTTKTITTTVPLAAPAPPATPMRGPSTPTVTSTRTRRQSLTLKGPAPPPPPLSIEVVRTSSRASSRRGSTGPPSARPARERHPRGSATPAATPTSVPPTPVFTAASRRSKRPAPGPVSNFEEGAPAVSIGKRKNAPKKRATAGAAKKAAEGSARAKEQETKMEEDAAGEDIDPDEPRYCICGDVSWGDMICCENNEVWSYVIDVDQVARPSQKKKARLIMIGGDTVRERMVSL